MKRLIMVAALATLAGCSQSETAPAPEAEATAEAPVAAAAPLAADGKATPGMYKITTSDGMTFMEEVKADGTYVQTDADGKVVETGKWVQKSPTEYCTTKDGEGEVEKCNTEGIDADGKWFSTNSEGKTATVERVEA
ncbi:hypothetical protein A6F68_01520 [Tsuneonella dongtanensis]|uniref:Membrane-bound lysozyme-inhibitor of c-type lysozyme n=1 Tax=Tsuneonella dongtanensis TaxID=692370 RepID=A0A1B2ADA6_9SPHN|nr:hypothetical protein [Tsuneonella dongtanensis]ANY20035.1 hypothetical protein A6F68_01520 [Tsuneonella dongtanensis]